MEDDSDCKLIMVTAQKMATGTQPGSFRQRNRKKKGRTIGTAPERCTTSLAFCAFRLRRFCIFGELGSLLVPDNNDMCIFSHEFFPHTDRHTD